MWPGAKRVSLEVFRPQGFERLYVLGGCADISREAAAKLLRPLEYIDAGVRVGAAAAARARRIGDLGMVRVPSGVINTKGFGDVLEDLSGLQRKGEKAGFVEVGEHETSLL